MKKRVLTFRSKVLTVIVATVIFTSLIIQFFAQKETERALSNAYEENALNLLNSFYLSVKNQHQSIMFHDAAVMSARKKELKNIVTIAVARVGFYYQQYKLGLLDEQIAKQKAMLEIKNMRYDKHGVGYIWINNADKPIPKMVMHPTLPELDGQIMNDEKYNCAMGTKQNLFVSFADAVEGTGEGYVTYLWPKPTPKGLTEELPKISFVRLFKPWNWIIGTGVYVDDINVLKEKRVKAVLDELAQTVKNARIARSGYLFLFSAKKQMLIHPSKMNIDLTKVKNDKNNHLLIDDLMDAAKTPNKPVNYIWDKPSNLNDYRFEKKAYVRFFEPLDLYIASTIYVDEIEAPVKQLRNRVILFTAFILVGAVIIAIVITENLTRPLNQLTIAATNIEKKGLDAVKIPIAGTKETIELGTVLQNMISSAVDSEAMLKKAHNAIASIIDSMPSVIVGVDAKGNVTQWNSKAEATVGLTAEEAVGQPLRKVYPRLGNDMRWITEAIASQTQITENRTRVIDRETRYENITFFPIASESATGAVIRVDDVTDRVKMEEMITQNEKMLSVGGLAAGMAHELNNPLAGMTQTATVLANRLSKDMPANIQAAEEVGTSMVAIRKYMAMRNVPKMLTLILDSGKRAAQIVTDMLSFARNRNAHYAQCNMVELLDNVISLASNDYDLKKKYDFREIEIVREYAEDLPLVSCDSVKIQQVLLNLLRNAAEAMGTTPTKADLTGSDEPHASRITIRLGLDEDEPTMIRIEVEDNGPGMNETIRKRVFEPFFTTKPTDQGTGLGLSVSYFIVTQNHNGKMSVHSTLEAGATFIIQLPIKNVIA